MRVEASASTLLARVCDDGRVLCAWSSPIGSLVAAARPAAPVDNASVLYGRFPVEISWSVTPSAYQSEPVPCLCPAASLSGDMYASVPLLPA